MVIEMSYCSSDNTYFDGILILMVPLTQFDKIR